MLSCAQDYRKGKPGYQQHIWQASLGGHALVFTTSPSPNANARPGYWAGNAILPKAVAHRNVLISLHRIVPRPQMGMQPLPHMFASHAWFPRFAFDQVVEKNGWVFGQKGEAYVALRCLQGMRWMEPDDAVLKMLSVSPAPTGAYELLCEGDRHAWVCELGSATLNGDFARFVDQVSQAQVRGDVDKVEYHSPSLGLVSVGWDLPLTVAGQEIAIRDYPRFDSVYGRTEFGEKTVEIQCGKERLTLAF